MIETYKFRLIIYNHLNRKISVLGYGTLTDVLRGNGLIPEYVLEAYEKHWSEHQENLSRDIRKKMPR